jgi:hypothetical protein
MKLLLALSSIAVVTAACASSAGTPGSSEQSAKSVNAVQLRSGANAGSDVSDIGTRPNPPLHKVPGQPPVAPPVLTPNRAAQPAPVQAHDRCSTETGRPGKPQPMCLPA